MNIKKFATLEYQLKEPKKVGLAFSVIKISVIEKDKNGALLTKLKEMPNC